MHEAPGRARVVVGVDGSLSSVSAIRWAAHQAQLRGALLCAVIVDEIPVRPQGPYGPTVATGRDRDGECRATLVDSLNTALGSSPEVMVHQHVEHGYAADVLGRYSVDAELLVLGSHRSDSPQGCELGPTTQGCIRTCSCPLAVITEGTDVIDLAAPVSEAV